MSIKIFSTLDCILAFPFSFSLLSVQRLVDRRHAKNLRSSNVEIDRDVVFERSGSGSAKENSGLTPMLLDLGKPTLIFFSTKS